MTTEDSSSVVTEERPDNVNGGLCRRTEIGTEESVRQKSEVVLTVWTSPPSPSGTLKS